MSLVSKAVAIANKVTRSLKLQSTVTQEKATAVDGYGRKFAPVMLTQKAVVEMKQMRVRTPSGEMVQSRASITFLDPAIVVDYTDKLTLADGTTGPILSIGGFVDGETGRAALTEVYLG